MAGKIFVTGDCHGDFRKLNTKNFPEGKDLDKEDYVIICGDFGLIWDVGEESKSEKHWLSWLEEKPFSILFIDGNHENFDRLAAYPEECWNGGRVHKIRESVLHLMRGQIYELAGNRIFTFGGASSHDTQGGILDPEQPGFLEKKRQLNRDWIPYRVKHVSWWPEEVASGEEILEATKNLEAGGNQVDYIITHCCSNTVQDLLGAKGLYDYDEHTAFLEQLRNQVKFKRWYFGHYHMDLDVTEAETLLYEKIVRLGAGVGEAVGNSRDEADREE